MEQYKYADEQDVINSQPAIEEKEEVQDIDAYFHLPVKTEAPNGMKLIEAFRLHELLPALFEAFKEGYVPVSSVDSLFFPVVLNDMYSIWLEKNVPNAANSEAETSTEQAPVQRGRKKQAQ